jgi:geranylgeranyl diphosphate synthase type II
VGDALLARAFEVTAQDVRPGEVAAKCCSILGQAAGATALVGGQSADLAMESKGNNSPAGGLRELEAIHRRKTGALIVASLELGGTIAMAGDEQINALRGYGEAVGLAFQITDDLLDAAGSQAAVGKRVAKDNVHGKLTYPWLIGCDESRNRAERLVADACAKIDIFGERAEPLRALAKFVCSRKN